MDQSLCAADPAVHSVPWQAPSADLGAPEVEAFLTHLAVEGNVAAATQNQTMLPESVKADLRAHLAWRRELFERDLRTGKAAVYLPDALARKYPNAPMEWGWQCIFPSGSYSIDPRSGIRRQHHAKRIAP